MRVIRRSLFEVFWSISSRTDIYPCENGLKAEVSEGVAELYAIEVLVGYSVKGVNC